MNIIHKITLQHLKHNPKRTIVTIVGVIISVAMMTAVSTIGLSLMDMLQRGAIANTGDWQVQYSGIKQEYLPLITEDKATKVAIANTDLGYAPIASENSQRPYLFLQAYDAAAYQPEGSNVIGMALLEGRWPANSKEIVLSSQVWETSGLNHKIGDVLHLNLGVRYDAENNTLNQNTWFDESESFHFVQSSDYTLVGIVDTKDHEYSITAGYLAITMEDYQNPDALYAVRVKLNQVTTKLYDHAGELFQRLGGSLSYNSSLLMYYGVSSDSYLRTTLLMVIGVLAAIIFIGSVSLIYNAFLISLSERSKYLGMLSSIGATKRQKRSSVYVEGWIVAVIAIPLGIASGFAGIGLTFALLQPYFGSFLNADVAIRLVVHPWAIGFSVVFAILLIGVACLVPAKRASRISSIDGITQRLDYMVDKHHNLRLIQRLIGFEAVLGIRNIHRNRNRYRSILWAFVISIVLFLTASGFMTYLNKTVNIGMANERFDVYHGVFVHEEEAIHDIDAFQRNLLATKHHTAVFQSTTLTKMVEIPHKQLGTDLLANLGEESNAWMNVNLVCLDEVSYQEYIAAVGITPQANEGIVVNHIMYRNQHTFKELDLLSIKIDDVLTIDATHDIVVKAITDILPATMTTIQENLYDLTIVVKETTLTSMIDWEQNQLLKETKFLSDNAVALENEIEVLQRSNQSARGYTINYVRDRVQGQQASLVISVFVYGFVALISLVCIANVYNTMYTSMMLRKREFAMLRSVGMTTKSLHQMLLYESCYYAAKALLYGMPLGIGVMALIYNILIRNFEFAFYLPTGQLFGCAIAVFAVILLTVQTTSKLVVSKSIVDGMKEDIR